MFINCLNVSTTDILTNTYNLSNHMIHALDIYIISDNAVFLDDILTVYETLEPKLYIEIDGDSFPLKYGSPGESPLNPIKYIRTGNIPNEDFIVTVKVHQLVPSGSSELRYGFGEGKFGYDEDIVVGFGGFGLLSILPDLKVVIEESKDITDNFVYKYEEELIG